MTPRIPAPRLAALLLVTLLFPIGCTSETASVPAEKKAEALRVAVIPKGTTHEFWKSIHAGAIQAERELEGIEIVWQGPQREDDRAQQLALVENFTATGIDAIVLAPLDDRALVAPCQQATGIPIPIVVIDSGLQGEMGKDFAAYVATDNYRGGQLAGENLGRILEGRGKVLLLRYDEGSASTEQREEGFVEAIRKFPGITLIDPERYAGATRDSAQREAENLLESGSYDGIFCPNESSTFGMLLALRAREMASKVRFVGFDASPGLLDALRVGQIDGLVVQNPMKMGYEGTKTAVAALRMQPFEPSVDTGVAFVTADNINDPELQPFVAPPLSEYLDE